MLNNHEYTQQLDRPLTHTALVSVLSALIVLLALYLLIDSSRSVTLNMQQLMQWTGVILTSVISVMALLNVVVATILKARLKHTKRPLSLEQAFLDRDVTAFEIQISGGDQKNYVSSSISQWIGHVPKSFGNDIFSFTKHISSSDRRRVYNDIKQAIEDGSRLVSHYTIKHENGQVHHIQINGRLWTDEHSGNRRFSGSLVCVDKLTTQQARSELLSQVFYASNDGIILTDSSRNIVAANPSYCEITGFDESEILGRNPDYFRSPKHKPEFYKDMQKQVARDGYWKGEVWNKRKTGESYPELLTITTFFGEKNLVGGYLGTLTDLADVKNWQNNLQRTYHQDALTGLPNRHAFNIRLENTISLSSNNSLAVFFIDIDNFKRINDSFGHETGDLMLLEIAKRFSTIVRHNDILARLGGDEFTLLVSDADDDESLLTIANKLIATLRTPVMAKDIELLITASIGISRTPADCTSADDLMKHADIALYKAKDRGRNNAVLYSSDLANDTMERVFLENDLRTACGNKEFVLYYQPQIDLQTGKLLGAEALIRWNHPKLGLVPPDRFISIAENTGLIHDIGKWVLYEACRSGAEWRSKGLAIPSLSVNLSGVQIEQKGLPCMVHKILKRTDYPADCLELEVTESVIMQNSEFVIAQLKEIRKMGISISVDDFGTGYSSLSYLKHLPINKLKIDRAFIKDTPREQNDVAITKAIINMSRSLNLLVCAEGVETPEQARFLTQANCHSAQGYYFARPLAAEDFVSWVIEHNKSIGEPRLASVVR